MQRGTVVTLGVVVLLVGALAGTATAATPDGGDRAVNERGSVVTADAAAETAHTGGDTPERIGSGATDAGNTIVIAQEYRLTPSQPGRIDVQLQFEIPDNVGRLSTRLPEKAENPRRDGFVRESDGSYVWRDDEQSTRTPTLTYTVAVNVTREVSGPEAADGQFVFADAGDWAIVQRQPSVGVGYRYPSDTTQPAVRRENTTAGPGVVGSAIVYLGPHEEHRQRAHGQRFRLIVPEAATLAEERAEIFESVTAASDRLRVGDRDASVLMIAAPTSVPWGVRGLQTGGRDFYVAADETLDQPDNVWLHEYVHTRQDFRTTAATAWTVEATAQYYAGLLTLEQDRIEFDRFRRYLERGASDRFTDVVLADNASWHDGANYLKGGLVAGDLDRRIRDETDSGATLQSVLGSLNRGDGPVTQTDFLDGVRSAGGASVRDAARRYTETTSVPSMWSRQVHGESFGDLPASFSYSFPAIGSDGLAVRGPYGERTFDGNGLVTGETLVTAVNVTNVGGSSGTYTLRVTRDGETLATRSGTLGADEHRTETVEATFAESGTYRLSTGDDALTVRVFEPATPVVTGLAVNRSTVRGDGAVTVTATVENRAARPGEAEIAIRRAGIELTRDRVRLAAGASTTVAATAQLSEPGTYRFEAGDETVAVAVEAATPVDGATATAAADPGESTASKTDTSRTDTAATPGASGPGFGVAAALLAGALFLVGRRFE